MLNGKQPSQMLTIANFIFLPGEKINIAVRTLFRRQITGVGLEVTLAGIIHRF